MCGMPDELTDDKDLIGRNTTLKGGKMKSKRVTVPVFVALATLAVPSSSLLGVSPASASAGVAVMAPAADESRESVLVTGTGEVSGTPDTLTANLGVETSASTVGAALEQAGAAATRMRAALTRAGVAAADLQTSDVSVT